MVNWLSGWDMQKEPAMPESKYLHEQAATARAQAEASNLQNVRSRYLNAAAVWAQLAARAENLERMQAMPLNPDW